MLAYAFSLCKFIQFPADETIHLLPGDTKVTFDPSTIKNLMYITLDADCHLRASDFRTRRGDGVVLRPIPRC